VIGDIATASRLGVAAAAMLDKVRKSAEGRQKAIVAVYLVQVPHRQLHNRNQIRSRPVPVHIRLADADISGEQCAQKKAFIVNGNDCVQRII
jgi:predicted kinase